MIHDQKSAKSQLIKQSVTKCSNACKNVGVRRQAAKAPKLFMDWGAAGTKSVSENQSVTKCGNFRQLPNIKYVEAVDKMSHIFHSHFITPCVQ